MYPKQAPGWNEFKERRTQITKRWSKFSTFKEVYIYQKFIQDLELEL